MPATITHVFPSPLPPPPSALAWLRQVSFDPQARTQVVSRSYNPILSHPRYPPDPKLLRPTSSEYQTSYRGRAAPSPSRTSPRL